MDLFVLFTGSFKSLTFSKLANLSIEYVVYNCFFLKKQVIGKMIVKSLFEQI